ncbi:MAG TPA: hypothetical protein VF668_02350 [Pyrinomonadaceae bacterium]|jgi:hypothetical protein
MLLALGRHVIWTRRDAAGGLVTYEYYDEYTWAAAALVLAWLAWLYVRGRLRARSLRRAPRPSDGGALARVVKLKDELSAAFLRPGFSPNIHAVGVGAWASGAGYCIQVFVGDSAAELWEGAGGSALPSDFRGAPLVLLEMPAAELLSGAGPPAARGSYSEGIRGREEVIVGGVSGANVNLAGQSGTIGYFCTRRSRLPRRREVHLLSNSHVFADLQKNAVDDGDLITQPSPGEPSGGRPVAALVNYSALRFDGDTSEPNHVDAAIARLWEPQGHKPVIPHVGAVEGHVEKRDVRPGEPARKFGRTTGYTEGSVLSVHLDIWVRYDRTGQAAFFKNQILVEPKAPDFTRFVSKGDSGSLVVDGRRHALGLVFAGAPAPPSATPAPAADTPASAPAAAARRVEGYGVANPISDVLERLKIDLLV